MLTAAMIERLRESNRSISTMGHQLPPHRCCEFIHSPMVRMDSRVRMLSALKS